MCEEQNRANKLLWPKLWRWVTAGRKDDQVTGWKEGFLREEHEDHLEFLSPFIVCCWLAKEKYLVFQPLYFKQTSMDLRLFTQNSLGWWGFFCSLAMEWALHVICRWSKHVDAPAALRPTHATDALGQNLNPTKCLCLSRWQLELGNKYRLYQLIQF